MRLPRLMLLCLAMASLFCAATVGQALLSSGAAPPDKSELFDLVIANQKRVDSALDVYERIERVETRNSASDAQPAQVKVSRVIPAGTGFGHIPLGPDGKPADLAAYREAMRKTEKSIAWAAQTGHDQDAAYEKVSRKRRERNELIDATRDAFLFTFQGRESRDARTLLRYSMAPNPSFHASSRAESIFEKVRGTVWIDEQSSQLARVEGEVTQDISFGLFLAKIYKGSSFLQVRREVVPGLFLPVYSQYDFDGRKFFSTFSNHERTYYSDYRRLGPPKEALAAIRAELSKTPSISPAP